MSRSDVAPDLHAALDSFMVPPPRADLTDRIMAAAGHPAPCEPRRPDRRGRWRMTRRVLIGSVTAGMISAAAVASGLLGAAGIRVPVLTAMLAPEPKAEPIAKPVVRRTQQARVGTPPVAASRVVDAEAEAMMIMPPMIETPINRRAARQAFLANHPEIRPALREAAVRRRAFVAEHPEVRALLTRPPAERRAMIAQDPALRATLREARTERKAFIADHPELGMAVREEIARRRAEPSANLEPSANPEPQPTTGTRPMPEVTDAKPDAVASSGDRALRIQQLRALRERRANLRALRQLRR